MSANYGDVSRYRKGNAVKRGDFLMRANLASFDRIRYECAAEVLCARCHDVLDRHQPDDELPDRLLGTCPCCSSWYLIDASACVMYLLPDVGSPRGDDN
jgi:hypothetical protein